MDDGSVAAGSGAGAALSVDDGFSLVGCGEAVGAADVEDGVLAGGEDGGDVAVAEHLLQLRGADGAEAGELGGGGLGVVSEVFEVGGEGDVGSDALVLGQTRVEDPGEELVEGGDPADAGGSVVLGAGGCGEGLQDGLELGAGVEGQEPGDGDAVADDGDLEVVLVHALDPGLVEVVGVGGGAQLLDGLTHGRGCRVGGQVEQWVHALLDDHGVDVLGGVGERVDVVQGDGTLDGQ
nr:hypothetical protein [Aeromicrobium sp. REDSEA-S32_B7]